MPNSHIDIATASIGCFTDDGTLNEAEVNHLVGLALRDGVVTDDEKRVLGNVFSKVGQKDVCENTWKLIVDVKSKYDIS